MSTAEEWYCNRPFKGLTEDGKPCEFARGDVVPSVEKWPTFTSLKNISWILPELPADIAKQRAGASKKEDKTSEKKVHTDEGDVDEASSETTGVAPKPVTKKKAAKKAKSSKKKSSKKASKKTAEADPSSDGEQLPCEKCGAKFNSSRALKVHARWCKK